jgi:hypothetical protein
MKLLRATPSNIAGVDAATRVMLRTAQKESMKAWGYKAAGAGTRAGMILAGAGIGTGALMWGAASFFPPKPAVPPPQPAERQITLVLPVNPAKENARPTEAQFKVNPASKSLVNVVVFRTKQLGKGDVQTGGRFEKPTQALPSEQWCIYEESQADGTTRDIVLGRNGKKIDPPSPSPFWNVDLSVAYSLCDWWPTAPAPSPHASND